MRFVGGGRPPDRDGLAAAEALPDRLGAIIRAWSSRGLFAFRIENDEAARAFA